MAIDLNVEDSGRTIAVKQGGITVNGIWVVNSGPDFVLVELDCKAKYPSVTMSERQIHLYAGPETMYADGEGMTTVEIGFPEAEDNQRWHLLVEVGRYSVRAAWIRIPDGGHKDISEDGAS